MKHRTLLPTKTWILPTHVGTHCEVVSGVTESDLYSGQEFCSHWGKVQGTEFRGLVWVNLEHRNWKCKALKVRKTSSQTLDIEIIREQKEAQWEELFSLLASLCLFQITTFETDAVWKLMPWQSQLTSGLHYKEKKPRTV